MVAVNRPLPLKMSVSSAKKQKISRAKKWFMSCRRAVGVPVGVFLQQLDVEPVEAAGGLDVEGVFADLLDGGDAGQRQKEAEVVVEVGVVAGDRFAIDEVLGLEGLAVGGEDELGLLPAWWQGFARSAASVAVTSPSGQTLMWMLLRWSTPPGRSDWFVLPARRRLSVVSLFPKASRKAKGKVSGIERRFGEPGNGFFDFDCVHLN